MAEACSSYTSAWILFIFVDLKASGRLPRSNRSTNFFDKFQADLGRLTSIIFIDCYYIAIMSRLVKLNVGGVQYTTSASTIGQYPDSMLAVMIEKENERQLIERGEELFIDRNGNVFKYVLEYLRNGHHLVLPDDKKTQRELALEAKFFQLDGLKRLVDENRTKYIVGDIVSHRNLTNESFVRRKICSDINRFDVLGWLFGTVVDVLPHGDLLVEFTAKIGPTDVAEQSSIDHYRDVSLKYLIPMDEMLPKMPGDTDQV